MLTNVIYCQENLELMRELPEEVIDLIYIDSPFFSNRRYEVIFGDGAEEGEEVVVTRHGKPKAVLLGFSEEEMEDYVVVNHPGLRRRVEEAWQEYLEVGGGRIDELVQDQVGWGKGQDEKG